MTSQSRDLYRFIRFIQFIVGLAVCFCLYLFLTHDGQLPFFRWPLYYRELHWPSFIACVILFTVNQFIAAVRDIGERLIRIAEKLGVE